MLRLLEIIGGVLVILWIIGFLMHFLGALINLILIAAIIVFVIRIFSGKSSR